MVIYRIFFWVVLFLVASPLSGKEGAGGYASDISPPVLIYAPPVSSYASSITVAGKVDLQVIIDEKGYPEEISIASTTDESLVKPAISWAKRLRFKPAYSNGVPIKVKVVIPLTFTVIKKRYTGIIEGYVREKGSGRALEGVSVFDLTGGKGTYTDNNGRFQFPDSKPGIHELILKASGYYPLGVSVSVERSKKKVLSLYMVPRIFSPYTIDVIAHRERGEVSEVTIPIKEVERVAGTGGDVIRVIQKLPGVGMINEISGALLVRGSGPFDNQILIDDVSLPYIFHFGDLSSVISNDLLKDVKFLAGGFSVRYGNALGGIVNAYTKDDFPDGIHGSAGIGTVMANFSLHYGKKEGFGFVGGRRSYFDLILMPIANKLADESSVKFTLFPYFFDYQLKAEKRLGRGTLTLLFLGSGDAMGLETDREICEDPYLTGRFYTDIGFNTVSISYKYRGKWFDNRSNVILKNYYRDWEVGATEFIHMKVESATAEDHFRFRFKGVGFSSGMGFTPYRVSVDSYFPRPPRYGERTYTFTDAIPIRENRSYSGFTFYSYLESEVKFGRVKLYPGIRTDLLEQGETGILTWDPRIRGSYSISGDVRLVGAIGIFHQFPSYSRIDPVYGNPNLTSEKAEHYIAGVNWNVSHLFSFQFQGYYKWLTDLIYSDITFPEFYRNSGTGYSWGVDIFLRKHFSPSSPWWGWISYSFSRSRRKYWSSMDWTYFGYDRPHVVNITLTYLLNERWELGLSWKYASGDPYNRVDGAIHLVDYGMYIPITSGEMGRNPPYHRLDLRVDRRVLYDKWRLEWFVEIINVYFRMNPAVYIYDYDYTNRTGIPVVPFMINLGVKGVF